MAQSIASCVFGHIAPAPGTNLAPEFHLEEGSQLLRLQVAATLRTRANFLVVLEDNVIGK